MAASMKAVTETGIELSNEEDDPSTPNAAVAKGNLDSDDSEDDDDSSSSSSDEDEGTAQQEDGFEVVKQTKGKKRKALSYEALAIGEQMVRSKKSKRDLMDAG